MKINKEFILIGLGFVLLIFLTLMMLNSARQLANNPFQYSAKVLGEDAVCQCSYTGSNGIKTFIRFTPNSTETNLIPFFN